MKKILLLLMLTCSIAFAAVFTGTPKPEVIEYDFVAVEKIHVQNSSGKINIKPMDVDKIVISATKHKFPEKCSYSTEKSDYSEIIVKVERGAGDDCEVDIDMKVPKEVDLNIWSGSGSVNISGIEGKLNFNVGSGAVVADGKFKKVEGKSGSGRIDLSGLTSGGTISVGSGPVNLRFLEYPMGRMDVKTGSGDANIAFPKGSKISATLDTGSGDVLNELGSSESAEFDINVKTGSGDLKVKAY